MSNLSLYELNNLVNLKITNLQNQINAKQGTIIEDSNHRWFTDSERSKLAGIQVGAEVNQKSFSYIKVDAATISADIKMDTIEFASGSNIEIVADITNDKIIINNTYTHPTNHLATIIIQDSTHRFVTDAQITNWNNKANSTVATTTTSGLMSAIDKTKIDSVEYGAQVNYTPSEMLSKLTLVDGNGSGLDADLLDGKHSSDFALVNHTHARSEFADFAHTHKGDDISTSVNNALTANGLNVVSGNTVNIAHGFNGGGLYINFAGANAAITEYKICNGLGDKLSNIRAKEVYATLRGTADYALNADLLDGYHASDFILNNNGIVYGPLKLGDTNTQILKGEKDTLKIQTALGSLELGVGDDLYAYINTNKYAFSFNQENLFAKGKLIWHEGNMGIGSGLNADKLDGHHWSDVQKTIINSFTQTLSYNGFVKLPNEVIIQWGVITPTSSTYIMFPLTFPNVCFGVVVSNQDNTSVTQDKGAYNINKFGFERNFGEGNSFWIAIGF